MLHVSWLFAVAPVTGFCFGILKAPDMATYFRRDCSPISITCEWKAIGK